MDIQLTDIQVKWPQARTPLFQIKNFFIPSGAHLFIEGASGKGKTTLLHLIAGLFLPNEGYVFIGNQRLNTLTDDERSLFRKKHMGLVFQTLNLLNYLTPIENIFLALPPQNKKERKDSHLLACQALDSLNLKEHHEDLSGNLSLGEQQRVAVCRILVSQPEIILADEPTSSLDQANSNQVIQALMNCGQNKTLIVVSHDQRLKSYFTHQVHFEDLITS